MNLIDLGKALRSGRRVYGTCVTSTSPSWPETVAGTGVDFVFIDTEHVPMDRTALAWMCHAFASRGIPPIVRIPSPDPYAACQALDGGAAGVVAPYVETVEEVRRHLGAVKYRPLKGERLRRVIEDQEPLSREEAEYLAEYNRGLLCVVNIESTPAVDALDEILALPGLDAILIGPHDLSISLRIPEQYTHPRFVGTIRTIARKGREAGVGVGIHCTTDVSGVVGWANEGLNFIIHATDSHFVREMLARDLAQIKSKLGETGAIRPSPGATTRAAEI